MNPILSNTEIGPFNLVISSYSFFFYLSSITVILFSVFNAKKSDLDIKKSLLVLFFMSITLPLGARVLNILTNPEVFKANPKRMLSLGLRDFSLMGGLILASIMGIILCRIVKLCPWSLADSVAPGLGFGIALIRIGCFLNGCCFGKVTNLPWGIKFPQNSPAFNYYTAIGRFDIAQLFTMSIKSPPLHPTQLYEMLAGIVGMFIAIYISKKNLSDGTSFLYFTLFFSAFRWINMYFRAPFGTLKNSCFIYSMIYFSIIIFSLYFIWYRNRKLTR